MSSIADQLFALSQPNKIEMYTKFFRANSSDICDYDKTLAIKIPELRKVLKTNYQGLNLDQIKVFLDSSYNEFRFFGQQVIKSQYDHTSSLDHKSVLIEFLLDNSRSINHWNLVDGIAPTIGSYWLLTNQLDCFIEYSNNDNFWLRRVAIVGCLTLLRTKNPEYHELVLEVISNNITHPHEYIQKAMGWILRELGKHNENLLISFLQDNWSELSPTTRSYATEKLRKTRDMKILTKK